MDKISVNKLVEEVKSNLPREIIVSIAQSCLNEKRTVRQLLRNLKTKYMNIH